MQKSLARVVAALFFFLVLGASAGDDLSGLWRAKQRFGPDARGTLILYKTESGWTADFMGRMHPVRVDGPDLKFELAGDEGAFRARLRSREGTITGQWTPPPSVIHGARYASPVVLRPDGPNRWRGTVAP